MKVHGLSAAKLVNEDSGDVGGGDVHTTLPEYRGQVYHHLDNTGAMYGGVVTAWGVVFNEMVGAGRTQPQ